MRPVLLWLALCGSACGGPPAAAPDAFRSGEVRELVAPPPGYGAAETLRARCSPAPRAEAFDDEALSNVDCSVARLSRVLRARAGELGTPFIFGKRCRARGHGRVRLECRATLARAGSEVLLAAPEEQAEGPAPSVEQVLDLDDPRPQDQDQIRVGFAPAKLGVGAGFARRAYAAVNETRWPSVGRRELGQLTARCSDCGASELRHALRITAGHVGAGEVASVRCFQDDGDLRCIATALAPWSS